MQIRLRLGFAGTLALIATFAIARPASAREPYNATIDDNTGWCISCNPESYGDPWVCPCAMMPPIIIR
jgi:hypothetical protein